MNPIETPQTAKPIEVTTTELLQLALKMHKDRQLPGAEKCYRTVLQVEPDNSNALHYLGVLLHQSANKKEGLELIQQSLKLDPTVGPWYNNLGNVLLADGEFEAAAQAYDRCAELDPSNLEVLNNLGVLHGRLGQGNKAIASLERALVLNPKFVSAHTNLAHVLDQMGRSEESFSHMADALALGPQDSVVRRYLVLLYGHAGRIEDAKKACGEWLAALPDDPSAQHMWASLGLSNTPDRASDAYVEQEFDGFAVSFDAKLASLDYMAPQWVGETAQRLLPPPSSALDILDVGCGTGLCGRYLKPYAKVLVGVDLSVNMLQLAKEKGEYDDLYKVELVQYLTHCARLFDLVVSADTLCYFGRLNEAFAGVRKALRLNGFWVFTVEAHALPDDFKLQLHGRYSHNRSYIEAALQGAGFSNLEFFSVVLRMENSKPVNGWLVNAQAAPLEAAATQLASTESPNAILRERSTLQ
jgi:predicted TPR repeat methyltransferase